MTIFRIYRTVIMVVTLSASIACGQLTYLITNDLVTITGYNGVIVGHLDIPSIIEEKTVTSIGPNAFNSRTDLTSVAIANGVRDIEFCAFPECTSLTNVVIPASVTNIEWDAFLGCVSLTNIYIPYGITSIEPGLLCGCTSLTNFQIPDSVLSIGCSAFLSCTSLTHIQIPDSVISIDYSAFENCSSLTNVIFGNNLAYIGNEVFASCSNLTCLTLPGSITNIAQAAFGNCPKLTALFFMGDIPTKVGAGPLGGSPTTVYYRYGTSGWGPTFSGRPTAIWPEVLDAVIGPAGFAFAVVASASQDVVVEKSTDLLEEGWTAVSTNTMIGLPVEITIPDWADDLMRFYRIVLK